MSEGLTLTNTPGTTANIAIIPTSETNPAAKNIAL